MDVIRREEIVYLLGIIPLVLYVSLSLRGVPIPPLWIIGSFIPAVIFSFIRKRGNYHHFDSGPLSSILSISPLPPKKKYEVRKSYEKYDREIITGIRLFSSLGSVLLAGRGELDLALFTVTYGMLLAHSIDSVKTKRDLEKTTKQIIEEELRRRSDRQKRVNPPD